MNLRVRITGGLLAGMAACLVAPGVATATDCGLPGSAGTGMSEVLNVQGDIAAAKTGGYLQIPFTVPAGAKAVQVRYSYDQPGGGCGGSPNTLDMGVYQPKANPSSPAFEQTDRRGWSGSAVKNLAIAENGFTSDAVYNPDKKAFVNGRTTRAYQPGPIQAGTWAVELGIAYVDPADTDGIHFHVQVLTSSDASWGDDPYAPSGPAAATVNSAANWYTGDLHVHGEQEPGNATMTDTLAAAFGPSGAGLDFITLVDHNNNVARNDMGSQTALYPGNLVIPGVEVTTYRGHWNNQGSSSFADFRGGPVYAETSPDDQIDDSEMTQVQDAALPKDEFAGAQAGGGWTQINHPAYFRDNPSACRGCAWSYSDDDTDFSKVDAIEISNSIGALQASLPFTTDAIAYYEHALEGGAHIAVVGSSDAHKAGADPISPVGQGATVVYSPGGLSKQGITDAIKAGHTYVKPFGTSGPDVEFSATGSDSAMIGDSISDETITLAASVSGINGTGRPGTWELTLLQDGLPIDTTPITGDGIEQEFEYISESGRYSIEVTRTSSPTTYVEAYTTPIWVTIEPSNDFTVKKAELNKKKGTAKLPVKVPGAGSLKLSGDSLATSKADPTKASKVELTVKPKGKLKKKLKKKGKLKVKPTIRFAPDGGEPASEKVAVTLKYKKHK